MENRFISILENDLTLKLLRLEEALERIINMDLPTDDKLIQVKTLLNDITITEAMLKKFKTYITEE